MSNAVWPSLQPLLASNDKASCVVAASGHRITFANGDDVLCATSGLWNVNLGYGNVVIADAVKGALLECSYSSLFRQWNEPAEKAATALLEVAGANKFSRVIFSTSGSAANDLVMKLVRQTQNIRRLPQKQLIVALRGSYHGLTYGSFSLTGEDLGQRLYGVDQKLIRHIGHNSVDELSQLMSLQGDRIAAVIIEPVLGTGAHPVPHDLIEALFSYRDQYGFLVVADEVATGFGRTGPMFASSEWTQSPDILVSSKGLTNGTCAAAAVLTSGAIADDFTTSGSTFTHGETQAGTPATAAAILATLAEFKRTEALTHAIRVSKKIDSSLKGIKASNDFISEYRGVGCFRAIEVLGMDEKPISGGQIKRLVSSIRREGANVYPGPSGIQIIPSLLYSNEEVDILFAAISAGLQEFTSEGMPSHA